MYLKSLPPSTQTKRPHVEVRFQCTVTLSLLESSPKPRVCVCRCHHLADVRAAYCYDSSSSIALLTICLRDKFAIMRESTVSACVLWRYLAFKVNEGYAILNFRSVFYIAIK
uniref:(northern house mosquito) hypothetical protein n=1 Tax=Culex pipiens TaxID=7175 RepID=A0A8D8FRS8_CULPI